MKYYLLLSALLFAGCTMKSDKIIQAISNCGKNGFQVDTYINNPDNVFIEIYYSNTWVVNNFKCLTLNQIDSAKKAEYKKAEKFFKSYTTIKK